MKHEFRSVTQLLGLRAGVKLGVGDEVEIEFTPPYSGEPLRVRGVVRNCDGYRYGVEFIAGNTGGQQEVIRLRDALRIFAEAKAS